jgi:hypothetical protein
MIDMSTAGEASCSTLGLAEGDPAESKFLAWFLLVLRERREVLLLLLGDLCCLFKVLRGFSTPLRTRLRKPRPKNHPRFAHASCP